jgi:hypothetical protein
MEMRRCGHNPKGKGISGATRRYILGHRALCDAPSDAPQFAPEMLLAIGAATSLELL